MRVKPIPQYLAATVLVALLQPAAANPGEKASESRSLQLSVSREDASQPERYRQAWPEAIRYRPDEEVSIIIELHGASAAEQAGLRASDTIGPQWDMRAFVARQQELGLRQRQMVTKLQQRKLIASHSHRFTRAVNAISATARVDQLPAIAAMPEVRAVTRDRQVRAFQAGSPQQVRAPEVWAMRDAQDRAVEGQGTSIAIIDSGIDYTHEDLGGCLGSGCRVVGGYDFVNDDSDPMDDHFHGTMVAGVTAAVAPAAKLYAYKVLNSDGFGSESDIIAAIEAALDPDGNPQTDDAVDVINLSLGGAGGNNSVLSVAANNAMRAGVVVVAAAGNDGPFLNSIGSPGSAEEIVTVGAVDGAGHLADFSSRGMFGTSLDLSSNSIKPEIVAPGVAISSTNLGGGLRTESGTSFAAPHVAGAAALLRQLHPELTSTEIKALLVNRATQVHGKLAEVGNGQLDAFAAASARFLVSPPTLYAGHFGQGAHTQRNLQVTVKNLSAPTEFKVANGGNFPAGADLDLSADQFDLEVGSSRAEFIDLNVDHDQVPYHEPLEAAYDSALEYLSGDERVRLPVAFNRAEVLAIRESEAPGEYWSYSAFLFNEGWSAWEQLSSFENAEPVLHMAVRDEPINILFSTDVIADGERYDVWHAFENRHTSDGELVVPARVRGAGIPPLRTESGETLQFMDQVLRLTHPEIPGSGLHLNYSGDVPMRTLRNLSDNFQINYMGLAEEGSAHPQDRKLYTVKHSQQGMSEDLHFDLSNSGSTQLLIGNPFWNWEGYTVGYGLNTYEAAINWWSYPSELTHKSSLLTLHGREEDIAAGPTFLSLYVPIGEDQTTAAHSNEISIGRTVYRKLRPSDKDFTTPEVILERSNGIMLMGQGPRYFAGGLRNDSGNHHLLPSHIGSISSSWIMDSWGNGYRPESRYRALCLPGDSELSSSDFIQEYLFFADSECTSVQVDFEYTTSLGEDEYTSSARVQLNNLDGATAPRIAMLELLDDGVISHYARRNAKLFLSLESQLPLDSVTTELALDGGDWLPLETALEDGRYLTLLPEVSESAVADLRIVATDSAGNSVQNTIRGAFVLGLNAATVVDTDNDGAVDSEDAQPFNPRFQQASSSGVKLNSGTADDREASPGEKDVVVQLFSLETDVESELNTLTLQASGNGDDVLDIAQAKLYLDNNSDGNLDEDDTILASSGFQADDGELTFQLDMPGPMALKPGESHFIVTYDFVQ
ncbi:S8 family serine peptidase [Microbulbifer variabilis]|uniref:S8 family serine peptidase n=1 Tax=Microbulbifer variabilis TaxID=266805 RepID=A0ABY4V9C7_9GAMM|nr:S8 family serine peptidase [Microbulbifer variabilis]USD20849.1 S8 family serine peptidase [Microbulbifer variabilis]